MDLRFNTSLAEGYKSGSQIARVLTEDWLARNMYCPICGEVSIRRTEPNAPVKDYVCEHCGHLMNKGWVYEGIENYCSDACLKAAHPEIDIDMLKVHAIEDNSNSYWTKWEENISYKI